MASGLFALMVAAKEEPLPFAISMYCGQMIVTGRVAPAKAFLEITRSGLWDAMREGSLSQLARLPEDDRRPALERGWQTFGGRLDSGMSAEERHDEVTLVDANVFPAVATQGTRSGGLSLPVVRVPVDGVDLWWILNGDTIRGHGGISWGAFFPIDI